MIMGALPRLARYPIVRDGQALSDHAVAPHAEPRTRRRWQAPGALALGSGGIGRRCHDLIVQRRTKTRSCPAHRSCGISRISPSSTRRSTHASMFHESPPPAPAIISWHRTAPAFASSSLVWSRIFRNIRCPASLKMADFCSL